MKCMSSLALYLQSKFEAFLVFKILKIYMLKFFSGVLLVTAEKLITKTLVILQLCVKKWTKKKINIWWIIVQYRLLYEISVVHIIFFLSIFEKH